MFPAHIFLRCPHYLNAWNKLALKAFAVVLLQTVGPGEGPCGRGKGTPNMGYIGMCRLLGYGFGDLHP